MTPAGTTEPSLPDKVISIHDRLSAAKIPHAFGGALALAYYAEPRATIDIDVNVFVSPECWSAVSEALEPLGLSISDVDAAALERDGQCRIWWGRTPLDLFFSYGAIHDEMAGKTRRVPFGDTSVPVLGPEHLAICKAMFDRPKDWLDIEQMLLATEGLNVNEIERWLGRMAGEQDPRLKRFEELRDALSIDG